jgi:hypothetical protein
MALVKLTIEYPNGPTERRVRGVTVAVAPHPQGQGLHPAVIAGDDVIAIWNPLTMRWEADGYAIGSLSIDS